MDLKKIKMFFHAHVFCIAQPTHSKALFPFLTGIHGALQCWGPSEPLPGWRNEEAHGRGCRFSVNLLPIRRPQASLKDICRCHDQVSRMAFFPEFLCFLHMSLNYSSVFVLKENTQGGGKPSQVLTAPGSM